MLSEKRELQNTQNKLIQNPTLNIDKRRVLILEHLYNQIRTYFERN